MPAVTITGTIKDSLGNAANGVFRTSLPQVCAHEDALILPEAGKPFTGGALSIAPAPSGQLLPADQAYTFRIQDTAGIERYKAAGVVVTAAMDTLDDIL